MGCNFSSQFTVTNGVCLGGVLSPTLFNLYIDDLSHSLCNTNVGCNLNGVSMNHLVYADDTVLLASSPSALQELIFCCEKYAKSHDIIYNLTKTYCMCIKPKFLKDIHVPDIMLNGRSLKFLSEHKYLGCIITNDFKDDKDIERQMRYVYSTGNSIIRNFKHCTDEVKLQLFKTFCSNFYCCQLWSNYKVSTYNKLRVAFNNVFRSLLKLKRDCSISAYMVNNHVNSFYGLLRKQIYGFTLRLRNSTNILVDTIVNATAFNDNCMNVTWVKKLF
jgi:hypothetical protein